MWQWWTHFGCCTCHQPGWWHVKGATSQVDIHSPAHWPLIFWSLSPCHWPSQWQWRAGELLSVVSPHSHQLQLVSSTCHQPGQWHHRGELLLGVSGKKIRVASHRCNEAQLKVHVTHPKVHVTSPTAEGSPDYADSSRPQLKVHVHLFDWQDRQTFEMY